MGHATQDVYVQDLIQRLGIHPDTITKSGMSRVGVISREEAVSFLSNRLEVKGHRTQAQVDAAILFLKELGVEANQVTGKSQKKSKRTKPSVSSPRQIPPDVIPPDVIPPSISKEPKEEPKEEVKLSRFANLVLSEDFLSAVVTLGLIAQVFHTVSFVVMATLGRDAEPSWYKYLAAIAIGLAIDMTAFMVSIRTKNLLFLQIALGVHIMINGVFYYIYNNGEGEWSTWFAQGILSVAIALANFSYSELFLSSISKNNSK